MLKSYWELWGKAVPTVEADIAHYKSQMVDSLFARARLLSKESQLFVTISFDPSE